MATNKPKMEFLLNLPTIVTLGNNFKNGQSEYGAWFGWGVKHEGVEKTLFADDKLHPQLQPFGKGMTVVVTKTELGGKQFGWHVAIAPPNGSPPPTQTAPVAPQSPAKPPLSYQASSNNGHRNRGEYRAERIARAKEAFTDALTAVEGQGFRPEDLRALAISFLIDEQRQNIDAPDLTEPF